MRWLSLIVAALCIGSTTTHAAVLRVENDSAGTTTAAAPGSFTVNLSVVAVTGTADGLAGAGWFGGNGLDVTHSVNGVATADIDPSDIQIGASFNDPGTNSTGIDDITGVRNLVFATQFQSPGPGANLGDRIIIARVAVRVTGAQGGDVITVKVNDALQPAEAYSNASLGPITITSRTAHTITIDTVAVNTPPVANGQNLLTTRDTPIRITLSATDLDLDPLTYAIISGPANGTLTPAPAAPKFDYLPKAGFVGSDSFTFRANDGQADSNLATVNITIVGLPGNDSPVADAGLDQSLGCIPGGTQVTLDGTGSFDPEGQSLTYAWTGPFGQATGPSPSVQLGPGQHTITLVVNDGVLDSAPDTVMISVGDTEAPLITCPDLLFINRTRRSGTPADDPQLAAWLDSASAVDECDPNPQVFHDGPELFALGRRDVTFMAVDIDGNVDACTTMVLVLITPEGDFDGDGDVDLADALSMEQAQAGSGVPTPNDLADFDGDGDADLADWMFFVTLYTGPK